MGAHRSIRPNMSPKHQRLARSTSPCLLACSSCKAQPAIDLEEGGATDSYQIALQSIPTANVQITVDPDSQTNLGAGAGVAIVLTFTSANALIPQTVNVAAVDDATVEGDHTSTIIHTLSSADTRYNAFFVPNVVANIIDNDAPVPTSIVISELMYNPLTDETSPGIGEWIEIVNAGSCVNRPRRLALR